MSGFADGTGVAVRDDGSVDPSSQLFRASFIGVETGPMVSQVLTCKGGGREGVVSMLPWNREHNMCEKHLKVGRKRSQVSEGR